MKNITLSILLTALFLLSGCLAKNESVNQTDYYDNAANYYVFLAKTEFIPMFKVEISRYYSSAGGVIVRSDNSGTYILTANHFCHTSSGPLFSLRIKSVFDRGLRTQNVTILNQDYSSDLCLLHSNTTISNFRPPTIILTDNVRRFEEIISVGSPAALYNRGERWSLAAHFGRWSGYATDSLSLVVGNNPVDSENILFSTLPATSGQSGSGAWVRDSLFGIIIATNRAIDDNSYMVDPEVIYLFLQDNNIFLEQRKN
jgi:S1-C subfamily serine protease